MYEFHITSLRNIKNKIYWFSWRDASTRNPRFAFKEVLIFSSPNHSKYSFHCSCLPKPCKQSKKAVTRSCSLVPDIREHRMYATISLHPFGRHKMSSFKSLTVVLAPFALQWQNAWKGGKTPFAWAGLSGDFSVLCREVLPMAAGTCHRHCSHHSR